MLLGRPPSRDHRRVALAPLGIEPVEPNRRDRGPVDAGAVGDREALAVLAQRGIAAWLDVLATLPEAAVAATPRHPEPLRPDGKPRTVDILLTMVRPQMPWRTA